jgi:small GTP-binding protein
MEPITSSIQRKQTLLTSKPKRTVDYKIVLLGESSVGKSSILERLQNNSFNDNKSSTIGAAFISKKIIRNETDLINLQIWDTAGQERFHNLTPLYYRNSNVAIVVFDLNNKDSFKKAEYWTHELDNYIEEEIENETETGVSSIVKKMKIILVGNKVDLLASNTCIFDDEIQDFIKKHKKIVQYFQTSAKKNVEILELFEYITNNIEDYLFQDITDDNKSRSNLIDLNFTGKTYTTSNCQC